MDKITQGEKGAVKITSISWDPKAGGLSVGYEVAEMLGADVEIEVSWATARTSKSRTRHITSQTIAKGTEARTSSFNVPGQALLDGADKFILAMAGEDEVQSTTDVQIVFRSAARDDNSYITGALRKTIKEGLRVAGQATATITSAARDQPRQVDAMFNNLVKPVPANAKDRMENAAPPLLKDCKGRRDYQKQVWTGDYKLECCFYIQTDKNSTNHVPGRVRQQKCIYGANGDKVIDTFSQETKGKTASEILSTKEDVKNEMSKTIDALGGCHKVSTHCEDPCTRRAIDVPLFGEPADGRFRGHLASKGFPVEKENGVHHIVQNMAPGHSDDFCKPPESTTP